jgi:hypothetical protein
MWIARKIKHATSPPALASVRWVEVHVNRSWHTAALGRSHASGRICRPRLSAVLILPPGHADALATRRRLSRRERWMVGGVLGTIAALAAVLVIALASGGPSSSHGCIYATIPAATGAQQVNECGATARETCRSVYAPGAFTAQAAGTIASECRKAELPVGAQ